MIRRYTRPRHFTAGRRRPREFLAANCIGLTTAPSPPASVSASHQAVAEASLAESGRSTTWYGVRTGEVDAVISVSDHVALIGITSSSRLSSRRDGADDHVRSAGWCAFRRFTCRRTPFRSSRCATARARSRAALVADWSFAQGGARFPLCLSVSTAGSTVACSIPGTLGRRRTF